MKLTYPPPAEAGWAACRAARAHAMCGPGGVAGRPLRVDVEVISRVPVPRTAWRLVGSRLVHLAGVCVVITAERAVPVGVCSGRSQGWPNLYAVMTRRDREGGWSWTRRS